MPPIKIKAVPRIAYNPKRPANALLLAHVRELEKAVAAAGRKVRRQTPTTEEQVAAYIRHLNRALHQQVLLPPMRRRALDVPLDHLSPAKPDAASPARKKKKTTSPPRKRNKNVSRTRQRSRRS